MIKLQDGVHINEEMLKLLSLEEIEYLRTASFERSDPGVDFDIQDFEEEIREPQEDTFGVVYKPKKKSKIKKK